MSKSSCHHGGCKICAIGDSSSCKTYNRKKSFETRKREKELCLYCLCSYIVPDRVIWVASTVQYQPVLCSTMVQRHPQSVCCKNIKPVFLLRHNFFSFLLSHLFLWSRLIAQQTVPHYSIIFSILNKSHNASIVTWYQEHHATVVIDIVYSMDPYKYISQLYCFIHNSIRYHYRFPYLLYISHYLSAIKLQSVISFPYISDPIILFTFQLCSIKICWVAIRMSRLLDHFYPCYFSYWCRISSINMYYHHHHHHQVQYDKSLITPTTPIMPEDTTSETLPHMYSRSITQRAPSTLSFTFSSVNSILHSDRTQSPQKRIKDMLQPQPVTAVIKIY